MTESIQGNSPDGFTAARSFDVGDPVRFSTFGLWTTGTVVEVRDGLVCIQPDKEPGRSWASQWRNPNVHGVVLNVRNPS